jgi:thiol reductant ABC exporter CydC subunit
MSATVSGSAPPARPLVSKPHARGAAAPLARTFEITRGARGRLALSTLLGAASLAAAIGLIATSAWLISRASQRPQESALAIAIVGVQFFGLSRGLLRYGERLVGHDAAFRVLASLRVGFYRRVEALAPAGLPAFRSADLLARLVHDVDSLQDLLLRVIPPFAIAAITGAATVTVVWLMLPTAGLILLGALLLAATVVPWITARAARRREARQASVRGQLTASVVDLCEGLPELTVNGALEHQLARASAADSALKRINLASARTAGVGDGLTTLLCGLAMWGSLLVGVSALRAGSLDGVLLAVIALIPLAAFELVAGLPAATQTLQRVRESAARVFAVADARAPVVDPPRALALPPPPYELRVRGLHARHAPDGPWVLEGVDLDLAPGRRVAVVGPSGAGKTTLAEVLLRFLPYAEGSVTLAGVEIDALAADEYRTVVGAVAQDAHVFGTTVEQNLRLARRDASDEQLRSALRRAGLLASVEELPLGLATEAGEAGARISGGERQRLAIARALLADFPLLILDEPAEHLDTTTADAIVSDVLAASDAGVLLITHRLTPLPAADEVIVLDRGRVAERGTHDELVAARGRYYELWRREIGC